jgi:DNA-binding CsgD family transcriptional regulator
MRFRSSRRDLDALADVKAALSVWQPGNGRLLERALPYIVELLDTEFVGCYLPMRTERGWMLEHGHGHLRMGQTSAVETTARAQLEQVVAAAPPMMRLWSIPHFERNRVISTRETWPKEQWETHPITKIVMPALGFSKDCYDLRVYCAEEGRNLGWCGAYQREPFSQRQRVLFQRLVPTLRSQVANERKLGFAELQAQAFVSAMDAIPYPSYLVDGTANVVHANALAQGAIRSHHRTTRARLSELLRAALSQPSPSTFYQVGDTSISVISAPNCPVHYLIIERIASATLERRVIEASGNWGLTARQREVLRLVAEGETNKEIASRLACSIRAVEHHISGILARAGLRNRAGLMSKLVD